MTDLETARQQNLQTLQKDTINIPNLDGVQLPRALFDRIIERAQEEAELLNMARVEDLPRKEMAVPQIGVDDLPGGSRNEEGSRTGTDQAASGAVELNTTDQFYYIQYDLKKEAVDNTMGANQIGEIIISQFERGWANGAQNIAINAGRSGSSLPAWADDTWDGWIAIAEGADTESDRIGTGNEADASTMPTHDHSDSNGNPQPLNTDLFNSTIQAVPERYRDPDDQVFLLSKTQVQEYHNQLTEREDGLGVAVLMGDNDVTPFEYDIVGVSFWPNDTAMLIDPDQLVYGIYEGMTVEQIRQSDKTMDEALHSRNLLEGQFDLQIEELQSGALATNIAQP